MANRFIDTEFFKRPFVRSLKAPLKTLYAFIICDCDNAGIWSPDFEIASIYVGQKIEKNDVVKAFSGKIVELKNGQWFFPDFIEHQYPKGLQENNPAHKKAIERLLDYKLIDKELKNLTRPSLGSKVMDKEEAMVIDKEKEEEEKKKVTKIQRTHPLQVFVFDKLDRIKTLKKQLTPDEAMQLEQKYGLELVKKTLIQMENYKQATSKYISVFLTCINWCERDNGQHGKTGKKEAPSKTKKLAEEKPVIEDNLYDLSKKGLL